MVTVTGHHFGPVDARNVLAATYAYTGADDGFLRSATLTVACEVVVADVEILCATAQGVAAANLAPRRELERLVQGERELEVLSGWKRDAVGAALLALLEGRIALVVRGGRLELNLGPAPNKKWGTGGPMNTSLKENSE